MYRAEINSMNLTADVYYTDVRYVKSIQKDTLQPLEIIHI